MWAKARETLRALPAGWEVWLVRFWWQDQFRLGARQVMSQQGDRPTVIILIPVGVGRILFVFRNIFSKFADQSLILFTGSMQKVSLQAVNTGRQEDNLEWEGRIADDYGTKNNGGNQIRCGAKKAAGRRVGV